MKAIVKTKNSIELVDKDIPALADDTCVLIQVTLAGLCRTDMFAAQNKIPVQEGITLGHEFTGIVKQIGSKVNNIHLEQRVSVMPVFANGHDFSMLGVEIDGAFAEYISVPASSVYLMPEQLTDKQAAFLEPVAASLAVSIPAINPDHKGLIYGNNRISELTRRILAIKGINNIDIACDSDLKDCANEYDFVIETTPTAQAFEEIVRLVKPRGLIVLKSRPFAAVALPITSIVKKEIKLIGAHYGDFNEGIDLLASGTLKVDDLFGGSYSLEEAIPILLGDQPVPESNKIFFKP